MQIDYRAIGFRCGIECHQRLASSRKLFCGCRNEFSEKSPASVIRRKLRATAGELGEIDPAAAFETARNREFAYQTFPGTTCLVECDEEPPRPLNEEALDTCLEVALLLKSEPVSEVHVMRKTVVDGSSCSGFQRTALIATGGSIETSKGPIAIQTICLEEESSGIVSSSPNEVVYRLDRQGIPLIEIATSSDIKNGEHAHEAAEKIGALLRATAKVQRGIGTIRQDLNVSIRDGARIEIKGAQDPTLLQKLIENEVRRQLTLLEIKGELKERSVKLSGKPELKDLTEEFRSTRCKVIKNALSRGENVMAVKLRGFAGLLGKELMPGHRLGTELFHYAKAAAGVPGIIHGDEDLRKYDLSDNEINAVRDGLKCSGKDAFVLCAAPREKAAAALEKIFERATTAAAEIPGETRKAEGEVSVFMRPIPGSARMYPETDVPPVKIGKALLSKISKALPSTPEQRKKKYMGWGLNEQLASRMLSSTEFQAFEQLVKETKAEPTLIATTLLETLRSLKRGGLNTEAIPKQALAEAFEMFNKESIVKHAIPEVLAEIARSGGKTSAREAVGKLKLEKAAISEIRTRVEECRKRGISDSNAIFNEIIRTHRLRVAPEDLKNALA